MSLFSLSTLIFHKLLHYIFDISVNKANYNNRHIEIIFFICTQQNFNSLLIKQWKKMEK